MERLLIINGCSHSCGSEIAGAGIGDGPICRDNSFGALLAAKLNREPVHLAFPGGSNDRIARTTATWIADHLDKIKNNEIDVLFLIHWTGNERSEYFFPESLFGPAESLKTKFMNYSSDKEYWSVPYSITAESKHGILHETYESFNKLFVNSAENWSDNKIKNIVYTQGILKQFDIPYWMGDCFYFGFQKTQTYNSLVTLIDEKYFPYHNNRDKCYYWMCTDAGYKNQDPTQKLWHLNSDAHKYYVIWLLEEINKANLNG
jgi:hypothetical protein